MDHVNIGYLIGALFLGLAFGGLLKRLRAGN